MVHTDIRFETITFPLANDASARLAEETHRERMSMWKTEDQALAEHSATYSLYIHDCGPAMISDLGEARIGTSFKWNEYVQPNIMRAPEVELRMDWGPKIDVWNAACLVSMHR